MSWKVGERVVCDRPGKAWTDCTIRTIDSNESVIIFCQLDNTVVCGRRENLERLGWRKQSQGGAHAYTASESD